jgi:hypothetical protein
LPPDLVTLFIDRNAWSNALHLALNNAGIPHEAHRWHFAEQDQKAEIDDSEWLRAVAERGWVVVTRDKNIRYRVNELSAMKEANLHVFVFTRGALTAAETGDLLVKAYPLIVKAVMSTPSPAFFSITGSGAVAPLRIGP